MTSTDKLSITRIVLMAVCYIVGYTLLLFTDWRVALGILAVNVALALEWHIREDYLG